MTTQTQINPELLKEIADFENQVREAVDKDQRDIAVKLLDALISGANLAAGDVIVHSELLD